MTNRLLPKTDHCTCGLRVLIVDNDPAHQKRSAELLDYWGYVPIVAEGVGEELIADAESKVYRYRCQVALVDMRLYDDHNVSDESGLELVPRLKPAVSIIWSGYPDWDVIDAALIKYGADRFISKRATPEQVRSMIEEATQKRGICGTYRPHIVWLNGLSSVKVRDLLFRGRSDIIVQDVPEDEANDVIGRVFMNAQLVVLSMIGDDHESSNPLFALRRQSMVFKARVGNQPAAQVVKIARAEKIVRELQNFKAYVEFGLEGNFAPALVGDAVLWDMGAIAYRYVGSAGAQPFRVHYRSSELAQILAPLNHFFSQANWGRFYGGDVTQLTTSLVAAYDETWNNRLSQTMHQEQWQNHSATMMFPTLTFPLINPMRWLADHADECHEIDQARQAVTHGDLHGDNLFVTPHIAFPIDFERTGPGPILRDFVELVQDILTRIADFSEQDVGVLYELAVALCEPTAPDQPMDMSDQIREHTEARKAFEVVQELQYIAHNVAHYTNRREYLWGLLLNNLFVVTRLEEGHVRRTHSLLFAAVICAKLERGA